MKTTWVWVDTPPISSGNAQKKSFFLRMSSLSRPFEIRVSPICFPTLPISWFVNQVRWKQPEPIIEAVAIGKFLQLGKFWLLAPNWWDTSKLPTLVTSLFIVWIKSKSSNQQLAIKVFRCHIISSTFSGQSLIGVYVLYFLKYIRKSFLIQILPNKCWPLAREVLMEERGHQTIW